MSHQPILVLLDDLAWPHYGATLLHYQSRRHDFVFSRSGGDIKNAVVNLMSMPESIRHIVHRHYMVFKHFESALPTASLTWFFLKSGASVLPEGIAEIIHVTQADI